jgi:type I restriction enzyme S subunit
MRLPLLNFVSLGNIRNLQIPLPPLPEQKKIAEILTTWDNAINKTTALIKAKEVLKKGLMQGLLLGKVQVNKEQKEVFKKTKLGVIPKHWTLKNAGDIFKSISIKNNENEELLAATQAKGIIPKRLLETNYTMPSGSTNGYKLVQDGNFVISLRSFQGGIEYSEYQGIISPAYTVLTNRIPIDKRFFRYFFKSTEFIGRLSVAVIGIRDGKQISFQDFSAMTFRFPPLDEQTKIANILETADKELELLRKELAKIEEQKRGLMQVLLTGKVRVKV